MAAPRKARLLVQGMPLTGMTPEMKATYVGQASWATGPARCWQCSYWETQKERNEFNKVLQAPCAMRRELTKERTQHMVPGVAPSCRYFKAVS